jgi:hypothetical protein
MEVFFSLSFVLIRHLKYHTLKSHGYTDHSWEEELLKKLEDFRKLITLSDGDWWS